MIIWHTNQWGISNNKICFIDQFSFTNASACSKAEVNSIINASSHQIKEIRNRYYNEGKLIKDWKRHKKINSRHAVWNF